MTQKLKLFINWSRRILVLVGNWATYTVWHGMSDLLMNNLLRFFAIKILLQQNGGKHGGAMSKGSGKNRYDSY